MEAVIVSTTMASVTELDGNVKAPVTFKLVVVTEVADKVVTVVPAKFVVPVIFKFVPVALVNVIAARPEIPDTERFVDVTLVIVVLAKTVRPLTFKLVVVTLVVLMLAGEKFVAAKLVKKPFVEVTDVPVAVVNPNAPESVPPVSNR